MHIIKTMKQEQVEIIVENYQKSIREARNLALLERLQRQSSSEDMLKALHNLEGLNVKERELAAV